MLVYNINVNKIIILDRKEVGFLCQSDAAGYDSPFGIKAIRVHLKRHTGRSRWEVASPVMRIAKFPFSQKTWNCSPIETKKPKLGLEKAEEPEIKLPTFVRS